MEARSSPWEILGIPENSEDAIAKSAWKKLIIKCHPDKVADELKAEKEEEFKRVNQAFQTITDPELRKAFDEAQQLRQQMREAGPPRFGPTPSKSYTTRTAAPPPSFHRAETWDFSHSTHEREDRFYGEPRSSSRKYESYEPPTPSPKHTSSRSQKQDRERRSHEEKASRSERRRTKDRNEKQDRQTKVSAVDLDSDERDHYEESYHRRSEEHRVRDRYDDNSRRYESEKKHTRSHSDKIDERVNKYSSQDDFARDYIFRNRQQPEPTRETLRRGSSGYDDGYTVRRSSARRESGRSERRDRDRDSGRERSGRSRKDGIPEVVDFPDRKVPSFRHFDSTPANIKVSSPRRSSEYERDDAPRPGMRRSETMPMPMPTPSHIDTQLPSRRKDSLPRRSSKLRSSENIAEDSGYSSTTSDAAGAQHYAHVTTPTATYHYASPKTARVEDDDDDSTVTATPQDYSNGHRTVLREPGSGRRNSASPIRHQYATYTTTTVQPRTSDESIRSPRHAPTRRSTDRAPMYREVTGQDREEYLRTGNYGKSGSGGAFGDVSYRKKFGPEDIKYGSSSVPRSGRDRRDDIRPSLLRRPEYVS